MVKRTISVIVSSIIFMVFFLTLASALSTPTIQGLIEIGGLI